MKPEQRIRQRVKAIFDCRNVPEIARRTGYPQPTLSYWKRNPLVIKAVDLERLENILHLSHQ